MPMTSSTNTIRLDATCRSIISSCSSLMSYIALLMATTFGSRFNKNSTATQESNFSLQSGETRKISNISLGAGKLVK